MTEPTELKRTVELRFAGMTAALPKSPITRLQIASDIAAQGGFRRLVRVLPGTSTFGRADLRAAQRVALLLGRLKGVPMKLGQLAGYVDSSIPEGLRPAFAALHTQAPALPIEQIRAVVQDELGPRSVELLASMEPRPMAVASLGQVHRAELDGVPVAVKVRYPGIDKTVRLDFKPAAMGTRAMMGFQRRGRRGDLLLREVMERVLEECDYRAEAERQTRFARAYEEHPVLEVPEIYPKYSSEAVLTSRMTDGLYLDDFLATHPDEPTRRTMAIALFELYVGSALLAGAYSTDPHPGSYLFCPDGRIAVLDYGSGRTLTAHDVDGLKALLRAALAEDGPGMRTALDGLRIVPGDRAVDAKALDRLVRWFLGPMLQDEDTSLTRPKANEVQPIIRSIRDFKGLDHPAGLVFLVRLRVALASVLERLQVRMNWRRVLETLLEGRYFLPPPRYRVVLREPGPRPIELLRVLRDEIGGAVRQAQALIDAAPCVVASDLERRAARDFSARLEAAGAKVDLRSDAAL